MSWWHYLLLVNFYLVIFFGFYVLLLRKETFFQLNRIFLVSASLLSFFIPLIQANWVKNLFITQQVQQKIYGAYGSPVDIYGYTFKPAEKLLTLGQVFSALYITVAIILVIKLMWQLLVLKREIEKPNPSVAYSFFKKISLGNDLPNADVIAEHEQVHARQWHTLDVLIIETIVIINWFNPVVYLYRFAIKYIHEFIADRQVLQSGTDKADYALLLLSQTFDVSSHRLVSNFYNHSLLKQRILMLQKSKSKRIALVKYGLSAPLFVLMLILSSATINNSHVVKTINKKAEKVFLIPASKSVEMITTPPAEMIANPPAPILKSSINSENDKNRVYDFVEIIPSFPGGANEFTRFLSTHVKYPPADRENNIQGRVIAQFTVEPDGGLNDIKVLRAPTEAMSAEAIRVLKLSPKWRPGIQNGRPVRAHYTLPVNFVLANEDGTMNADTGKVYEVVQVLPSFPGGVNGFTQFLASNIKYPAVDKQNRTQGKAILQFIVEPDGSLSHIKVLRSPTEAMGNEAVRVLGSSPKWKPGLQNGNPVRAQYTVPISFSLVPDTQLGVIQSAEAMTNPPLIIINGVEAPNQNIRFIDPETIESVSILKNPETAKYGTKGQNGVILITTKPPKTAPAAPVPKN